MTENMAARGEGLAGLVAEIKAIADAIVTTNAYHGRQLHRVGEKLLALEAAAPAGTAQLESEVAYVREFIQWAIAEISTDEAAACAEQATDAFDNILAALATPSPQAPPILLQDFNAKSGFGVFVVTGEHQRTAFFTRAAAEQYLAQQDPERFKIVMYPKPPAAAGSEARHKRDLSGHDLCPICGHSHSEWGAAVAAMHESPSTLGSPRKVGEDAQPEKYERTHSRVWVNAWNAALEEVCGLVAVNGSELDFGPFSIGHNPKRVQQEHTMIVELIRALKHPVPAARSSSVPVGEQKQEEGV